ncbi:MAG: hypothetical protein GEU74_08575 [Nitriliruptorales bacterium]|nr:hypothetical protein [Nitriliruptorales bacterium]
MRGASAVATYLGRILVVLGFMMIVIAWNGAAGLDYIQGQFPFLLSGAMPGLGLIIIGAGVEYVQSLRTFGARRAKQMAELNVAVMHLVARVREQGGLIPAPESEPVAVPAAAAGRPGLSALDTAGSAFTGGATPTAPAAGEEIVIAGRSSYHRSSCHLVAGREDLRTLTRLEAEARSLSPCRVCKP